MAAPTRLLSQSADVEFCGCAMPTPFVHATGALTCQVCEFPIVCRVCWRPGHGTFACVIPKAVAAGARASRQATFKDFPDDHCLPAA